MKVKAISSEDLVLGWITAFVTAPLAYQVARASSFSEAVWSLINFPHSIFIGWYWSKWLLIPFALWCISLEALRRHERLNLVTAVASALTLTGVAMALLSLELPPQRVLGSAALAGALGYSAIAWRSRRAV